MIVHHWPIANIKLLASLSSSLQDVQALELDFQTFNIEACCGDDIALQTLSCPQTLYLQWYTSQMSLQIEISQKSHPRPLNSSKAKSLSDSCHIHGLLLHCILP